MSSGSPSPNSPVVDTPQAQPSSISPPPDPPPPSAPPPQLSSPLTLPPSQLNSSQADAPTLSPPSVPIAPPPLPPPPPNVTPSPPLLPPANAEPPSPPPTAPPPPPNPPPSLPPTSPPPPPPPNPPPSLPPTSPPPPVNSPPGSPTPSQPSSSPPPTSPPPNPPPESSTPSQPSSPPPPPLPPPNPAPGPLTPSQPSSSPPPPPTPSPSNPPPRSPAPSHPSTSKPISPPPNRPRGSMPPSPQSEPSSSPPTPSTTRRPTSPQPRRETPPPPASDPPKSSTQPSNGIPPPPPPFLSPDPSVTPPVSSNSTPTPLSNSPPMPTPSVIPQPAPSLPLTPGPQPNNYGNNNSNNTQERLGSASNGGIGTGATVAIVLVLGLVLFGVFGTVACCIWKRKKKAPGHNGGYIIPTSIGSSPKSSSNLLKANIPLSNDGNGSGIGIICSPHKSGSLGNSRSWFTYEELFHATNGFSAENILGEGGFGSVYKGSLVGGREVAVKQLKTGGQQGEREFRSEVEIISRIHHRHLVSLVGYCISEDRRLLVYDYLPNNTLYFHLHGRPVMDWATRVKIAVGAARGIAYLHEDCHPRIIHRDIKSSNILLDNNFEARVSDFGLAKLAMGGNTHITTRVMGTFGYMAPEYASSGKLTEKSDVYSFGVVLLELVTGRKPVDTSQPLGEESVVEWARPLLNHALQTEEFKDLADPRLEGNYVDGEMFQLIQVAAACVRHSAAKRPKMGQVIRAFDSMATSDLMNGMKVGESEIFNSAQADEEIRLFEKMAFSSQDYGTSFFSPNSRTSDGNQEGSRRE